MDSCKWDPMSLCPQILWAKLLATYHANLTKRISLGLKCQTTVTFADRLVVKISHKYFKSSIPDVRIFIFIFGKHQTCGR